MSEQASLDQRVDLLDKKVDLLTEDVSELKATVGELKTSHEELKTTAGELKTSHEELKATVGELKTSHDDLKISHGELKTSHDKLYESFTDHVAEFKEFKALQETRHEQVMQSFRDLVKIIGERFDEQKSDMLRESRVLAEQTECRQINILFEKSAAQKATLSNHERRIGVLENRGSMN